LLRAKRDTGLAYSPTAKGGVCPSFISSPERVLHYSRNAFSVYRLPSIDKDKEVECGPGA
jgi:hypothetical protein